MAAIKNRRQTTSSTYSGVRDRSLNEFSNRYNSNSYYGNQNQGYTYEGSAARNVQPSRHTQTSRYEAQRYEAQRYGAQPQRRISEPKRRVAEPQRREGQPQRRQGRKTKALVRPKQRADQGIMTTQYTVILIVAAIATLSSCVLYISSRAEVYERVNTITALQQSASDMKIENDAKFGIVGQNVNMESVKQRASEMGMAFMEREQIIEYQAPVENVVIQYDGVPSSGVLAQSEKTFE